MKGRRKRVASKGMRDPRKIFFKIDDKLSVSVCGRGKPEDGKVEEVGREEN